MSIARLGKGVVYPDALPEKPPQPPQNTRGRGYTDDYDQEVEGVFFHCPKLSENVFPPVEISTLISPDSPSLSSSKDSSSPYSFKSSDMSPQSLVSLSADSSMTITSSASPSPAIFSDAIVVSPSQNSNSWDSATNLAMSPQPRKFTAVLKSGPVEKMKVIDENSEDMNTPQSNLIELCRNPIQINRAFLERLLKLGVNLNEISPISGQAPLHEFFIHTSMEKIQQLFNSKSDRLNHYNYLCILRNFLEYNGNFDLQNKEGKTPMSILKDKMALVMSKREFQTYKKDGVAEIFWKLGLTHIHSPLVNMAMKCMNKITEKKQQEESKASNAESNEKMILGKAMIDETYFALNQSKYAPLEEPPVLKSPVHSNCVYGNYDEGTNQLLNQFIIETVESKFKTSEGTSSISSIKSTIDSLRGFFY